MSTIDPIADFATRSLLPDADSRPGARLSVATLWQTILPLLIAVMAVAHVYRSPADAAGVEISPDEVEYVVAAQRIATLRTYDISVDGRSMPPRYSPWFSLLLAPIYRLTPDQLGAGIFVIQGFAAVAALAAFALGRRLAPVGASPELAGVIASALLVTLGSFDIASRFIMTDIPATALWLVLTCRFVSEHRRPWVDGILIAIAVALRPTALLAGVPFLVRELWSIRASRKIPFRSIIALCVPSACLLTLQSIYQFATFGSLFRSGYHYWCPVPYDFPAMVFSTEHLSMNIAALRPYVLIGQIGVMSALLMWKKNLIGSQPLFVFILAGALPLTAMHMIYFCAETRFHLPMLAILAIFAGAGLATIVRVGNFGSSILVIAIVVFTALMPPARIIDSPGTAQFVRNNLARATPPDAVILTAQDLVWMEPAIRGSDRKLVPLTRAQEYASKRVARNPLSSVSEGTDSSKTSPAVSYAVEDEPGRVETWLSSGAPVYLDVSAIDHGSPVIRQLLDRYPIRAVPGRLDLWQLELP